MIESLTQRYSIIRPIGRGSFGCVYLAEDRHTGPYATLPHHKLVVVKRSRNYLSTAECSAAMREVRMLNSLAHPFIVRCINSWVQHSKLNIVMEFCPGGDLQGVIAAARESAQQLSEQTIRCVLIQMLLALHSIHSRNHIHRDVKPANILIAATGCENGNTTDVVVKLGDFGLCRALSTEMDFATTQVGTPTNVAPEILYDNSMYNTKVDLWSLGVVIYEMMTLRIPFGPQNIPLTVMAQRIVNDSPTPIPDAVLETTGSPCTYSPELQMACMAMLTKKPLNRPSARGLLTLEWVQAELKNMSRSSTPALSRAISRALADDSALDIRMPQQLPTPNVNTANTTTDDDHEDAVEINAWRHVVYKAVYKDSIAMKMTCEQPLNLRAAASVNSERRALIVLNDIIEVRAAVDTQDGVLKPCLYPSRTPPMDAQWYEIVAYRRHQHEPRKYTYMHTFPLVTGYCWSRVPQSVDNAFPPEPGQSSSDLFIRLPEVLISRPSEQQLSLRG